MVTGSLHLLLWRAVGILAMLLGIAGIAACGAGVFGCWWTLSSVNQRLCDALERVETLLDATSDSFGQIGASLQKADKELEEVHEAETVSKSRQPQLGRAASRKLASKLTSSLGDSQRGLRIAVEAAVVVNSLLDGFDEIPLVRMSKLDTEQLQDVSTRVASLTDWAQRLQSMLETSQGSQEVDEESSRMRKAVVQVMAAMQKIADQIDGAKGRIVELRSRITRWFRATQVGLTLLLLWIALGQWCLLVQGWSWCWSGSRHG